MIKTNYEGFPVKQFEQAIADAMYPCHGDPEHHQWMSFLYGVGIACQDLMTGPTDLKRLFAGFITDESKQQVFSLLRKECMAKDVKNLGYALGGDDFFDDDWTSDIIVWILEEFELSAAFYGHE